MSSASESLRQSVRDKYAAVARGEKLSCCGSGDDAGAEINMIGDAYDGVQGYVADADLKLGCGLPVEHAGLAPGQTVLDLGSGAGLDAFVARRIVGETGRVLGVDFTPEMVAKAQANADRLGYDNVAFEHGDIEDLPFPTGSVDVVVSNCVLNLVPDKPQAFAEMQRVLRPGGHFCVSDVVSRGDLPEAVRESAELYAGCVAGAIDQTAYLAFLAEAGFERVEVVAERPIMIPEAALPALSNEERAALAAGGLYSVTVRGVRPGASTRESAGASEIPERQALDQQVLRVFDPPQCCSTGVCGPDVDPALIQFAADLKALAAQDVLVERYNLAQQPEAFLAEPAVHQALNAVGTSVLPLIVVSGRVVSHGRYPAREELERLAGLTDTSEPVPSPEPALLLDVSEGSCCGPGSSCC